MRKWLLLAMLLCAVPARATITLSQHLSNLACAGTSCTVSGFSAIAAGSFIGAIGTAGAVGVTATAGASNAGTWSIPSTCTGTSTCAASDATAHSAFIEYIPSSTGTPTSIIVIGSNTLAEAEVVVLTFTGLSMSFDVGASVARTVAATNLAGLSPGTITGTNDYVLQGGIFSGSATGCPNAAASPADFPNGNAFCGILNTTSNTAGTYANTSSRAAIISIAFKETPAAGGKKCTITLLGAGVC